MKTFINWLNWLTSQPEKKITLTHNPNDMKDICKTLRELKPDHKRGLVILAHKDNMYWNCLPLYAQMYIRKPYEMVTDNNGLIEFLHHFLIEYSETKNEEKKIAIQAVVFPIYEMYTGHNYDTNLFTAFGIKQL